MRVDSLDLLAYGHHRDVVLDLSGPGSGLTVVCGPNEAGKSTAMRALLAALFGVPASTPDGYVHGRAGLRVGARIVGSGTRELTFVRQGLARSPLVGADGSSLGDGALEPFLAGVGRDLFERIFSVGHEELRTHSEELLDAGGEIGRLVFGATLGSGSVSGVLRRLDDRAADLYKEGGRAQRVMRSLTSYREGMRRARDGRVRSREWDRRREAVAAHRARVATLRARLGEARAEQERLTRARHALPLLAQRAEIARRLGEMEAEGVVAPAEWAERAGEAQGRFETALATRDREIANEAGLAARVAAVEVDEEVLARAARIDEVVQGVDRFATNERHLGERGGQLREAERRLGELLAELGLSADDGRLVAGADLTTVEDLAQGASAIEARLLDAKRELSTLESEIGAARARLGELAAPPDVADLARGLDLARPVLPRAQTLPGRREAIARLGHEAGAVARRLGLEVRDLSDIEALEVPPGRLIADEQSRRDVVASRLSQLDDAEAASAVARRDLERRIDEIRAMPGVPDPDALAAARRHRDAGWQLVRTALEAGAVDDDAVAAWAGSASLAATYEDAVDRADRAADQRYDHAHDLTSLDQLRSRLEEVSADQERQTGRRRQIDAGAAAAVAAWSERWSRVGVAAGEPTEMAGWLAAHQELVATIARLRAGEHELAAEEAAVAEHAGALGATIVALGSTPVAGSLEHLVAQADEIVERAEGQAAARRDAEGDLRRLTAGLADRRRAVEEESARLVEWRTAWASALGPLALAPQTPPGAALQAVRAHRGLPGVRQEVEGLGSRIRGIERDVAEYVRAVGEVAAGVVDADGRPVLDVVAELRRRRDEATGAAVERRTLESQHADAAEALRAAELALDVASGVLRRLREEMGLPAGAELQPIVGRSRAAAGLRREMGQLETNLVAQGAGHTLGQILAEIAEMGLDGDGLSAAIDVLEHEIEEIETALGTANQALGEARTELDAVTGTDAAADLEQEAEAELASAAGYAAEYARTAVAAEVLRHVISDYGERHRGPMLDRAGEIFSRLTGGAFTGLVPEVEGERQVLLARRRSGELCRTAALSDGARDQLYFALRLAGIEDQLDRLDEPLPVVFDDVLVNFDEDRTEAAIGALADLGERAQVLLFTHHEGVVDAARRVLAPERLGVVRIAPRDHDAPLGASGGRDGRAEPRPASGGRGSGPVQAQAQVALDALRSAGRSLAKAEILARAGLADESWPAVVRSLLASGAVVQEGRSRGARYRLRT